MARQTRRKSSCCNKRSSRGGGFSIDPSKFVSVGNPINLAYTGVGKDCPGGSFVRPGMISNYGENGMPGMKGGYQLAVAPVDHSDMSTPMVSAPSVPSHAVQQKGGRYESNPGALISGDSDIGMKSYSAANRIACEHGSMNSLNMRGGAVPTVAVGAADSMRVYVPTAGHSPKFETYPGGSAVGGLMLNTPYEARAFNSACTKTGGGSVADNAGPYAALEAGQITGRGDFDGSKGLLPMKYGGKRSSRRKHNSRKRSSSRRKHNSHKRSSSRRKHSSRK